MKTYTEHPTYTGSGCAHCGKPKSKHIGEQKLECPDKSMEELTVLYLLTLI